ncbi:hypothetical protein J437_LFUL015287 [Ladona fulva]|uniref:Uncharacterized protein n=1 Tax=Ladona fulva TaxID=123851 RepID=A0A8K0PC11_LADFU|nr:hypothetical protein J437_LFUL015287 [Ladona fulva]
MTSSECFGGRTNTNLPLGEYNLTTVTYGVASAPYLAIRTLQKLVEDEGSPLPDGITCPLQINLHG